METVAAPDGFTALEDDEGGDGADVVALSQLGVAVNVDLDDVGGIAYLALDFFENRGLHLARATPCGKEINECGLRVGYDFVKFVHIGKFFNRSGCVCLSIIETLLRGG